VIDVVTGGRGGKPEKVLWNPFFKKEGKHYQFRPEVWSDYHKDLMEAEHRLRKEEKSNGNWKKLRKAIFFTCYHGFHWVGATVFKARDFEKLERKGVLDSFFQNEQVKEWLAYLWDA